MVFFTFKTGISPIEASYEYVCVCVCVCVCVFLGGLIHCLSSLSIHPPPPPYYLFLKQNNVLLIWTRAVLRSSALKSHNQQQPVSIYLLLRWEKDRREK